MFDSILVVCVGNICRSPTGERLLRARLPGKVIDSAGLGALVGHPAESMAVEIAGDNGLSLDGHLARQLTPELCRQYDLMLVMEKKHIEAITQMVPESRGKTLLFGHWCQQTEIADPYRRSREMFELVYQQLSDSADGWVKALRR